MKILVTCNWYIPHALAGSETRLHRVCKALIKEHDVHVYCRNNKPEDVTDLVDGVRVTRQKFSLPKYRLPRKPLEHWQDHVNAGRIREGFDLHISTSFGYALTLKKMHPDKELKFSVTALINYLDDPNERGIGMEETVCRKLDLIVNGYLEGKTLRAADKVIVGSKFLYDATVDEHRVDPKKMRLVPYGIDLSRFSGKRDRSVLKSFGISDDKFVILAVSSLCKRKNIPLIINSMKYMDDNSVALIVGNGDKRLELEKLAKDAGVDKRIVFAGPVLDVERYYAAADIFVHTSTYEPFANALLEGLASGLPCIGLKFSKKDNILVSSEEIITEDVGFCVNNDEKELAQAMNILKTDIVLRQSMAKSARIRAQREYSLERYVKDLMAA
jgi:glycosyltransferase involved in cell wall biosynthesis